MHASNRIGCRGGTLTLRSHIGHHRQIITALAIPSQFRHGVPQDPTHTGRTKVHVAHCANDTPRADPDFSINRPIFSATTKYTALRRAESDIKAYCENVEDPNEAQKCYATLARLETEERKLVKGMEVLENAVDAQKALERLDSMARQLAGCGSTKLMVDALHHLQEKQAQAASGTSTPVRRTSPPVDQEVQLRAKSRLREVFDRVDSNGNGRIDIAEFRAAMDYLGHHLDGPTVSEICQALDIHAGLDFEQFCEAVDAEDVCSPEAPRLRALLHNSNDDHFKDWIDSWG